MTVVASGLRSTRSHTSAIPTIDPLNLRNGLFMIGPKEWDILFQNVVKNRRLNRANLTRLIDEIEKGAWSITPDAIAFTEDGRLINGQHRGRACIATGRTLPFYVVVGIEERSFDVIDAGAKRSATDLFSVSGIQNAAQASSICRLELGYRMKQLKPKFAVREVLAVAEELPDLELVSSAVQAETNGLRGWCSQTALGWVYMRALAANRGRAVEWFDGIAKGINLDENDPRYAARRHLQGGSRSAWQSQRMMEQVYILWRSWEYFVAGASVTKLHLPRTLKSDPSSIWPNAG